MCRAELPQESASSHKALLVVGDTNGLFIEGLEV